MKMEKLSLVLVLLVLTSVSVQAACTGYYCQVLIDGNSSNRTINQSTPFIITGNVVPLGTRCISLTGWIYAEYYNGSSWVNLSTGTPYINLFSNATINASNPQYWKTILEENNSNPTWGANGTTPGTYQIRTYCRNVTTPSYPDNSSYIINLTIQGAPVLNFTEIVPGNGTNFSHQWLYINITSNIPLSNATVTINGTVYALIQSNSTLWYYNFTFENVTQKTFYVNGTATNGLTGVTETRTVNLINICGDITQNSTLEDDIYSSYRCITIKANDVEINCNGHSIGFDSYTAASCNDYSYGIYNNGYNRTTLKNCYVYSIMGGAIYCSDYDRENYPSRGVIFTSNVWNTTLINVTSNVYSEVSDKPPNSALSSFVFIDRIYNLTMVNVTAKASALYSGQLSSYGLFGQDIINTTLFNFSIMKLYQTNEYPLYGFSVSNGLNITVNRSSLGSLTIDLSLINVSGSFFENSLFNYLSGASNSINNILRNDTFTSTPEVYDTSNVTVQWFGRVNITNPLAANVNVSDINGKSIFAGAADSNGLTTWLAFTDYYANSTGRTNFNNHSINASFSNYFLNQTSFNLSGIDYCANITLYPIPKDTNPPLLTLVSPTLPSGTSQNKSWAFINVSSNEPLSSCLLNFSGYYSMSELNSTVFYFNRTGLTTGTYAYSVECNDTSGNNASTESRSLIVDVTPPTLTWVSPTPDGETLNQTWVYLNMTASETLLGASVYFNETWYAMAWNGVSWWKNITDLANGTYYFNASGNDTLWNTGNSDTRSVVIAYTPPPPPPPSPPLNITKFLTIYEDDDEPIVVHPEPYFAIVASFAGAGLVIFRKGLNIPEN